MKFIQILLIVFCTLTLSCQNYDDSALWDELEAHAERIAALEALCQKMNSNISALESIVEALQENDYVTSIYPLTEEGVDLGYKITFSKSGTINIYHGKDGAPGAAGAPGQDGADGADGKDGHTPVIGVRKDMDGVYYWTLDGEWLTDSEGNKIPTTGKDGAEGNDGEDGKPGQDGENGQDGKPGADGEPGQDGANGITPLLKIENEYWYVSYDNGKSWEKLYKAVGENGKDGQNGAPGKDGQDGQSFFQSVDTTNPNYIILTLADGSQIKIPTWKAFEELQTKVNQMNSNLSALQTILQALEANIYVTEIAPIIESSKETGYIIYLSDGQFITIYHGKDGSDGAPGQDGEDGKDGADGADGHNGYTPKISVKQGEDGNYYWTVDGEWMDGSTGEDNWVIDGGWLTDGQGNKIPATGKDGITPTLRIVDGYWYISYDNGKTWSSEPLGPATAYADGGIFKNITYDDEGIYITLSNGETITLSRREQNLLELCDISPINITDRGATFIGSLNIPEKDLPYSQITIYYSDAEWFTILDAESITTSFFDYNCSFSIVLSGLKAGTRYSYCVCVKVRGEEVYGEIGQFWTEDSPTLKVSFENGTLVAGSGYYYDTVHINGFALPLMKEDIPEKIDYVRFYLKGMNDGDIRDVTAEIGYFTDAEAKNFVSIKSVTIPVTMSTEFTLTDFPLECTKAEIESAMAACPGAIYWATAYHLSSDYPPSDFSGEGYNYSIGAANGKTEKYAQIGKLGLYYYKNHWAVRNSSNTLYTATVTVVPPDQADNDDGYGSNFIATKTYDNPGYVRQSDGSLVSSSTWIHSDFIPIEQLCNGIDDKCVGAFIGHGTVAAIAFYSEADDFSSYTEGYILSETKARTTSQDVSEILSNITKETSKYVVFSTDGSKAKLQVTGTFDE